MIQQAAKTIPEEEHHLSLTDLISLKDAKIGGGSFAMRPLNPAHIQQLVISDQDRWPAIIVTRLDGIEGYIVVNGYHRWQAARLKEVQLIRAIERSYPDHNAIIDAAFRSDLTHGLSANMTRRGDYAFWLHKTFPKFPQEQIAERAGMTQGAVSKAISRREDALQQDDQEVYIDPKKQRKAARRAAQRFLKRAVDFLQEVDILSDEELAQLLKPEDYTKLERIARLLSNDASEKSTPTQHRLHQVRIPGNDQQIINE